MELKGGAELMLCRLANLQSESGNTVYVVVLRGNSKLAHQKLNKSIHLIELKHKNSFGALFSFIKILRLWEYSDDMELTINDCVMIMIWVSALIVDRGFLLYMSKTWVGDDETQKELLLGIFAQKVP